MKSQHIVISSNISFPFQSTRLEYILTMWVYLLCAQHRIGYVEIMWMMLSYLIWSFPFEKFCIMCTTNTEQCARDRARETQMEQKRWMVLCARARDGDREKWKSRKTTMKKKKEKNTIISFVRNCTVATWLNSNIHNSVLNTHIRWIIKYNCIPHIHTYNHVLLIQFFLIFFFSLFEMKNTKKNRSVSYENRESSIEISEENKNLQRVLDSRK